MGVRQFQKSDEMKGGGLLRSETFLEVAFEFHMICALMAEGWVGNKEYYT